MKDSARNKYGLTVRDVNTIQEILSKYPEVETIHIFGSRAMNKFKHGSDIDLAVINEGVDDKTISLIRNDFQESSLPYRVDIVQYPALSHENLKNHIDRAGVLFYKSGKVI